MKALPEPNAFDDDFNEPIDEWTLDELDRSADLESLRTVWSRAQSHDD